MIGPITMTPELLATALTLDPTPVRLCPRCQAEHWTCVWCLRHDYKTRSGRGGKIKPSGWEQQTISTGEWATLCTKCADKRMRNPWNALLPMRIRGAS